MRISRERKLIDKNIIIIQVREEYPEHSFYYINSNIEKDENILFNLNKIKSWLDINDLTLLMGFGFGFNHNMKYEALQEVLALIYLCDNEALLCDIQLVCTDKKDTETFATDDELFIKSIQHYDSRLYYISGIRPELSKDCYEQAYTAFMILKSCLERNNIDYKGLLRTWLYLNNILNWYDKLNLARADFFNKEEIYDKLIPASTGIGLGNHYGSCLSLSAFAVSEMSVNKSVRVIESPMQCPAQEYKSLFSRAIEVNLQKSKRLLISGTASIDNAGSTIYPDCVVKQVDHTMKVVRAMLENEGYEWENTVRAVAYFPDRDDMGYFLDYCHNNNIDSSYFLLTGGTICRKDLLFELELDAVKSV